MELDYFYFDYKNTFTSIFHASNFDFDNKENGTNN